MTPGDAATSSWPCLQDGEPVAGGRIAVDAGGPLVSHGEGLFETLPVVEGRARFLGVHLRRLDAGCRALGLGQGPAEDVVRDDVRKLAKAIGRDAFSMRLTMFRDAGRVRRLLVASPLPDDVGHPVALGLAAPGLDGPRSLGTLKTLNYLVPRLAHEDGAKRGFDEVLFTLPDGRVLEGTRSSVFLVAGGAVVTPPLSLPILPGVTREVILGCARNDGIEVVERAFTIEELRRAQEAFISASVRGVRPVKSFEGAPLPVVLGPATRRIADLYAREWAAP
jgi:branched-subunit amino acid aminotransferase/4-amino-4-deoxychorismate lyase